MTASYRMSRKISAVCSMHSTRGTILSMLDGSRTNFLSIYWICDSNRLCSAFSARQQEIFGRIFAGTNFRELAFDRENRENFPLYGSCLHRHSHSLKVLCITAVPTGSDMITLLKQELSYQPKLHQLMCYRL